MRRHHHPHPLAWLAVAAAVLLVAAWAQAQGAPDAPAQPPAEVPAAEAPPAEAPPPPPDPDSDAGKLARAKELNRQGLVVLETGDHERALDYFRRSRELYPSSQNVANEAFCLHRLGRFDEALEAYERLLTRHGSSLSPDERQAVGPAMTELRKKVGSIWVSANVEGTVVVDGRERAMLPMQTPIRVLGGKHDVVVTKPGYDSFKTTVEVAPEKTVKVDARLDILAEVGRLRVEDDAGLPVEVYVDGVKVGTAPWEGLLGPGDHLVWTRHGEQGSGLNAVTVLEGQIALVRSHAELLGPAMTVVVKPRTAQIEVDGVAVGAGSWAGQLPEGDHTVSVYEDGYHGLSQPVSSRKGDAPIALSLALEIDPDHPRWPSPFSGDFWLDIFGGYTVTNTLNSGAEDSCPSGCTSDPPVHGIMTGARGGYRFPGGLSLELGGGYLWFNKQLERTEHSSFGPANEYDVTYELSDDIAVRGPFVSLGASYRLGLNDTFSLVGRTSIGVFFSVASDDLQGTAHANGTSTDIYISNREPQRQVTMFVMPALGLEAKAGAIDLGLGLGLAVFPFFKGPELANTSFGAIPNPDDQNPGSVGNASGSNAIANEPAYRFFMLWVPQISAGYTF